MSLKWFVVAPSVEFIYTAACRLGVEVLLYLAAVDGGAFGVSELVGLSGWWRCYLFDYAYGPIASALLIEVFSYFVHIGLVFRWSFTKGSC